MSQHPFNPPKLVPDKICKFLGLPKNSVCPRPEITEKIYEYIKDHNLNNTEDKRITIPDEKLIQLFDLKKGDVLGFKTIQTSIKKVYDENIKLSDEIFCQEDFPTKSKNICQEIIIDQSLCMAARKHDSNIVQCKNKQKYGDLCDDHHISKKQIHKIDELCTKLNIKFKYDNSIILTDDINEQNDILLKELSGPAYKNLCLSSDPIDILSQEQLWIEKNNERIEKCDFDKRLIFSYRDNEFIRCFNIQSLLEQFEHNIFNDPFTQKQFSDEIIQNIRKKEKLLKEMNINIVNEKEIKFLTPEQNMKNRVTSVFQLYDRLGLYLKVEWFHNLTKDQVIKIYHEAVNMWESFKNANKIAAPRILKDHEVFKYKYSSDVDDIKIRMILLDIFEKFASSGEDVGAKTMGAQIILGAFVFVSQEVKNAYPNILFQ